MKQSIDMREYFYGRDTATLLVLARFRIEICVEQIIVVVVTRLFKPRSNFAVVRIGFNHVLDAFSYRVSKRFNLPIARQLRGIEPDGMAPLVHGKCRGTGGKMHGKRSAQRAASILHGRAFAIGV